MKKTPSFSVVIPVYNKGEHIQRSICSVLNQTHQDLELILINDASTDNSLEEIQKFTDSRIRLFSRDTPGPGGYAARNLGIRQARSEWVAFLDADDEWYPWHLRKMYALFKEYPDIYLFSCGWQMHENGLTQEDPFYRSYFNNRKLIINLSEYIKYCFAEKRPVCSSVACIRKSSKAGADLFPSTMNAQRGGDLYAWLKILCLHKQMVWSNHIGAVYYTDSVNMVTKTATASPQLMGRPVFNVFSAHLTKEETILLKKYFNRQLIISWHGAILRNSGRFNIRPLLYLKGVFFNAAKYFLASFLPAPIIKIIHHLKVSPVLLGNKTPAQFLRIFNFIM